MIQGSLHKSMPRQPSCRLREFSLLIPAMDGKSACRCITHSINQPCLPGGQSYAQIMAMPVQSWSCPTNVLMSSVHEPVSWICCSLRLPEMPSVPRAPMLLLRLPKLPAGAELDQSLLLVGQKRCMHAHSVKQLLNGAEAAPQADIWSPHNMLLCSACNA
jgi:hypothetical protein